MAVSESSTAATVSGNTAAASRKPKVQHRRAKRKSEGPVCPACRGSGFEAVPDLSRTTLSKIAKASGRSASLLSRMFSSNPLQKRPNPTLKTMRAVCAAIQKRTGTRVTLDALASWIEVSEQP